MRGCVEEILACALRNHHDSVAPREDPLFEGSQETAGSVGTKWDFGDKSKVDVWLAIVAPAATNPALRPINLTTEIPLCTLRASV